MTLQMPQQLWFMMCLICVYSCFPNYTTAQKTTKRPSLLLLPLEVSQIASNKGADAEALYRLAAQAIRNSKNYHRYRLWKTSAPLLEQIRKVGLAQLSSVFSEILQKPDAVLKISLGSLGKKWLLEVELFDFSSRQSLALLSSKRESPLESLDVFMEDVLQLLWVEQLCRQTSPSQCYQEGDRFFYGRGVQKDLSHARRFYKKACDLNHGLGCHDLGYLYKNGRGVTQDYTEARKYYTKACFLNAGVGCAGLGILYENGRGVTQDYAEARKYYTKACFLNAGVGCAGLGVLYGYGQGVTQDNAEARKYYTKACFLNAGVGCHNLRILYEYGRGVTKSCEKAVECYKKACRLGYKPACRYTCN